MKWIFSYLPIFAVVMLVSCNPTEQTDVDYNEVAIISSATFSYNASSLSLEANTTSFSIYPNEVISGTYQVTPSLPAGVSLNASSGEISGTPTTEQSAVSYRITATTSSGSVEVAFVSIEVLEEPPKTLSYGSSILAFEKGSSAISFSPTTTGGTPDSYSIDGTLPSGLSIDDTTGVISGTPTVIEASTFKITASNSSGAATTQVLVSVRKAVPIFDAPGYDNDSQTIDFGAASDTLTNMNPDLTTPIEDSQFSIVPDLPAGVTIDEDTGVISGTPTEYTPLSSYTVTAYNEVGSDTYDITINFEYEAISLEYPANNDNVINAYVVQNGVKIAPIKPTYVGGDPGASGFQLAADDLTAITAAGLSFDTATGIISGTPTATMARRQLDFSVTSASDVTATNTETATMFLDIAEDYPEDSTDLGYQDSYTLSVSVSPSDHCLNVAASTVDADITDENICRASALKGWDETDGECYTIDTNSVIDTTITTQAACDVVSDRAWIDTNGATPIRPLGDGIKPQSSGRATKYEISAALPAGLSLNDQTGEITGTPLVANSETPFTITGYTLYGDGTDKTHTHTFNLTVQVSAPQALGYTPTGTRCFWNTTLKVFEVQDGVPLEDTGGENCIFPIIPKGSGVPTSYAVTPKLPDGLSLDPLTGIITGTSNEVLPVKYYTITGTNSAGSVTESFALSTNTIIAPQSLVYDTDNLIELTIFTAANIPASYEGGQGTFTTTATLPLGLTLNPNTGEISGTPMIAYDDVSPPTFPIPITITNVEGTLTTNIQIDIENITPDGFNLMSTADFEDNATDDGDIVLLREGESVDTTDITMFSDYDTDQSGGYINSYSVIDVGTSTANAFGATHVNSGANGINLTFEDGDIVDNPVDNYAADGVTATPDGVNDGALPTDPREYNPAPITYRVTATANNIAGADVSILSNAGNDDSNDIQILVVEQPPEISFDNVGNRVVLQGGKAETITPNNTGGLVANNDDSGTFATAAALCTATSGAIPDIVTDINGQIVANPLTFNASSTCEFTNDGSGCFETLTTNVYSATITAHNSGTNYSTGASVLGANGVTTNTTVYAVDGPDFTFEPDATNFAGETFLTLDASDNTDAYLPTPGTCHQGDFNLTVLASLPSPLSFSGSDGEIAINDNVIVGRRAFTLSSNRNFGAFTIDQEESITVQANHVHSSIATNPDRHIYDVLQFDFNSDNLQDALIWDTYCRGSTNSGTCAGADSEASIYLQNSTFEGVFNGTSTAFTIGQNIGARAINGFYYDNTGSTKSAVMYIADGTGDLNVVSASEMGVNGSVTPTSPAYGVLAYAKSGVSNTIATIALTGGALEVEKYSVNPTTLALTSGGTVSVQNDTNGGADVTSITFVKSFDLEEDNGDGDMEAVVAYVDGADHKICILGNDGTDLSDTCDTRLTMPSNEVIVDIKFADVIGDDDAIDMIVYTFDDTAVGGAADGVGDNVIYVYQNRNADFAGLFQNVDTLSLKSDVQNIGFDVADVNGDGRADIIAGDIEGDINDDDTTDGLNTSFTLYYHSGNDSNIYTDLVSDTGAEAGQEERDINNFLYMLSAGTTNEIELISNGSSVFVFHCQTDNETAIKTSQNASCGVTGTFSN